MTRTDAFRRQVRQLRRTWRKVQRRLRSGTPTASTMIALLRPDLSTTPPPLRRLLEPLVAIAAAGVVATLAGMAALSFAAFMLACALMYAVLTQIFGLELSVQLPHPGR